MTRYLLFLAFLSTSSRVWIQPNGWFRNILSNKFIYRCRRCSRRAI